MNFVKEAIFMQEKGYIHTYRNGNSVSYSFITLNLFLTRVYIAEAEYQQIAAWTHIHYKALPNWKK